VSASAWQSSKASPKHTTEPSPSPPGPPGGSASRCNYPPRHRTLADDDQGNCRALDWLRNSDDANCEEARPDGRVGPGTTFVGDYKGMGPLTFRIVDYDRPRRVAREGTAS